MGNVDVVNVFAILATMGIIVKDVCRVLVNARPSVIVSFVKLSVEKVSNPSRFVIHVT